MIPAPFAACCELTRAADQRHRGYRNLIAAIVDDPRRVARLYDLYAEATTQDAELAR